MEHSREHVGQMTGVCQRPTLPFVEYIGHAVDLTLRQRPIEEFVPDFVEEILAVNNHR